MKNKGRLFVLDKNSPSPPATAELIERSRAGDRQAFQALIERYQRLVAMIVFRIVPQREDALDLCQDVFLKVYEHLGDFRAESEFSTWIGRIARNTALNHIKRQRLPSFSELPTGAAGVEALSGMQPSPEQRYQADERSRRLEQELAALPEADRVMLSLFHQQGMDYESIARILELPVSSVKSHLFRSRQKLRQRLGGLSVAREVS